MPNEAAKTTASRRSVYAYPTTIARWPMRQPSCRRAT